MCISSLSILFGRGPNLCYPRTMFSGSGEGCNSPFGRQSLPSSHQMLWHYWCSWEWSRNTLDEFVAVASTHVYLLMVSSPKSSLVSMISSSIQYECYLQIAS